jgi:hypothetical protein
MALITYHLPGLRTLQQRINRLQMLQFSAVEPRTLDVLRRLMQDQALKDFHLAGGTALALYYGHRFSVDIDLFCTTPFDNEKLAAQMESTYPDFRYRNVKNAVGVLGFVENIKTDFIQYHHHPMLKEPVSEEGIRLYSVPDLIAMKISAILKRAVKKDFWDISELLKHHTIDEFITYYGQKYPSQQVLISIPVDMTYFSEAEDSEEPLSLHGQTWINVKNYIRQRVNEFLGYHV